MTAADDHGDGRSPRRGIAQRFRTSAVSRAHQCRPQLAFAHRLDEFAHSVAHPGFDRIEPVVEAVSEASCEEASFVAVMLMAWSPVRRFSVGPFDVDHPGDYATLIPTNPAMAS